MGGWVEDVLGGVVGFVDANQAVGLFEHVGPEGDDHQLGVAGTFL